MSEETKKIADGSDRLDELVMCSVRMCACTFADEGVCRFDLKCEHQITEREVAESRIAYKEAAQIQ